VSEIILLDTNVVSVSSRATRNLAAFKVFGVPLLNLFKP
jgi:hypothetical protein